MSNGDIPHDPDPDNTQNANKGTAVSVGVVVGILVTVCVIGWIYTAAKSNDPGVKTCSTSCIGFLKFECPGGRYMGTCFGVSVCDQPVHTCGVNAQKLDPPTGHTLRWALMPGQGAAECRPLSPEEHRSHKSATGSGGD